MNKEVTSICAVYSASESMLFDIDSRPQYSSQDDCIQWLPIEFYGIAEKYDDDIDDAVCDGDFSKLDKDS
jgi:hypothetical protein